jgi:hypothetical protein
VVRAAAEAAGGARAQCAASDDRFFDPRLVRRLWKRWGKPAIHWYATSHIGFLTNLPEVLGVMRDFIDRRTSE